MHRRPKSGALALGAAMLVWLPAAHAESTASPLQSEAARAVSALAAWAAGANAGLGAVVLDAETGATLAESDAHRPRNPASNAKIPTAGAVLDRFGPDHRFTTGVYGRIENGACAALVLRGDGDPSLETDELWQLASALYDQGLRRVDAVFIDQSRYDAEFVPPAFEQQKDEWAPFRAPVSAVSLERNAVTLNVAPGRRGAPATVWFDPPGFVDVRGTVETREHKDGNGVRLTLTPAPGSRLVADVGGFIGEGTPRVRVGKRVDDPRLYAGFVLKALLKRMGVDVRGDVTLGGESVRARLAYVESAPVSVLVSELGKNSDNFYAETMLKNLGALVHTPATSKDGAAVVTAWLKEIDALDPGTVIANGSGLFDANRESPWTLARVLLHARQSPRIEPEFAFQLSVGGVDGTLKSRFKKHKQDRAVRAKSGTLDAVIALSGYVLAPNGRAPLVFSFIADNVTGKHADARDQIDKAVEALAAALRR